MKNTIKSRQLFESIFETGKRLDTPNILAVFAPVDIKAGYKATNSKDGNIAYAVSKKLGNAVTRNHIKRQLRAASQEISYYPQHNLVVLVAKKSILLTEYNKIVRDVKTIQSSLK